jgi:hypothetical protein
LGKEEKHRMMVYTWIYWHPSSEPLGISDLKEGAGGAVGKKPQQRRQRTKTEP